MGFAAWRWMLPTGRPGHHLFVYARVQQRSVSASRLESMRQARGVQASASWQEARMARDWGKKVKEDLHFQEGQQEVTLGALCEAT